MDYFNIHNILYLKNEPISKFGEYISFYFNAFKTTTIDKKKRCIILKEINFQDYQYDELISDNNIEFSKLKDNFQIKFNKGIIKLSGVKNISDISNIVYSKNVPKSFIVMIIELIIRFSLIENNVIMVHASAIENNSNGTLFPAWKKTGKTTLTLKLLEKSYNFLSDDKIFINSNMEIFSFPKYLVIKDSNYRYLKIYITRKKNMDFLFDSLIKKYSPFLYKIKLRIFRKPIIYLEPSIFKHSKSIDERILLKNIIYIEKSNIDKFNIKEISKHDLLNNMNIINNYEFNYPLLKTIMFHDKMFPVSNGWNDSFRDFIIMENKILSSIIVAKNSYILNISNRMTNSDWNEIVEILGRLV